MFIYPVTWVTFHLLKIAVHISGCCLGLPCVTMNEAVVNLRVPEQAGAEGDWPTILWWIGRHENKGNHHQRPTSRPSKAWERENFISANTAPGKRLQRDCSLITTLPASLSRHSASTARPLSLLGLPPALRWRGCCSGIPNAQKGAQHWDRLAG